MSSCNVVLGSVDCIVVSKDEQNDNLVGVGSKSDGKLLNKVGPGRNNRKSPVEE